MFGLKYILETYKISNSDLADDMGINRANISMWIKNKQVPENKIEFLAQSLKAYRRIISTET
jgi:transcriptional regulator with XRE-family HTH domain